MNKNKRFEIFSRLRNDNPEPTTELNFNSTFELLIAVILSAQATDKGVNKATEALFKKAPTPKKMAALKESGLKKVQVKTTRYKRDYYEVALATKGGNRSGKGKVKPLSENLDILFIITDTANYLIPLNETKARKVLRLGPTYDRFKV